MTVTSGAAFRAGPPCSVSATPSPPHPVCPARSPGASLAALCATPHLGAALRSSERDGLSCRSQRRGRGPVSTSCLCLAPDRSQNPCPLCRAESPMAPDPFFRRFGRDPRTRFQSGLTPLVINCVEPGLPLQREDLGEQRAPGPSREGVAGPGDGRVPVPGRGLADR